MLSPGSLRTLESFAKGIITQMLNLLLLETAFAALLCVFTQHLPSASGVYNDILALFFIPMSLQFLFLVLFSLLPQMMISSLTFSSLCFQM